MRIIIEGCDGVGKSLVAQELAKRLNLNLINYNREDPRDYNFYQESLRKANYVMDRNFISERIYAEIYNSEPQLNVVQEQLLYHTLHEDEIFVVILTADLPIIKSRLKKDEHPGVVANVDKINQAYREVFEHKIKYGIMIDTSYMFTSQIVDIIVHALKGNILCTNI